MRFSVRRRVIKNLHFLFFTFYFSLTSWIVIVVDTWILEIFRGKDRNIN